MNVFNVGLIGIGRHGLRYAQHLLAPLPQARLIAVSRRNMQEGMAFAQRYGLRFYQRYHDLIADPDVDAVLAVTHPSLNLAIAREAIRHRKPILIEKPLATTDREAVTIAELAHAAGVPVMTGQTLRYEAAIRTLKEQAPALGPWRYLVLTARMEHRPRSPEDIRAWKGRGALLEIGIHLLDLIRFLTNESVRQVDCTMGYPSPHEPEDCVWARLLTESGLPCLLDVSRVSGARITRAEIVGTHGQGIADWSTSTVQLAVREKGTTMHTLPPTPTIVAVLQAFFRALEAGTAMPVTAEDGWRAVELAEACYRSASSGHPIQLPVGLRG